MYSKKIEQIFTQSRLKEILNNKYKKAHDYYVVLKHIESGEFLKEILKGYIPKPVKSFFIPKNEHEKRELVLSTTSSKVIQKILYEELEELFDFSDKSYAFRKNKGSVKAVNRAKDFSRKYFWIAKADIESFFDNIDHEKLIGLLNQHIQDKRVVKLISVFISNGMLKETKWIDKIQGVYQGDNLSPLLANIYLDSFDKFLESKHIDFVRYSDDILFFGQHKRDVSKVLDMAEGFMNSLGLTFGKDKSYIANKKEGFEYLGIRFKDDNYSMDNDKLQKKISKLHQKTKKLSLKKSIEVFNEHILGVKNHYDKLITDKSSYKILQKEVDSIIINKIVYEKSKKITNKKSLFLQMLHQLNFYVELNYKDREQKIANYIKEAYEKLELQKPLKSAKDDINKKKRDYLKDDIKSTEIVLSRFGLYLGVTKGYFTVKEYGKVIKKVPIKHLKRVMVLSKGSSISTSAIYLCSKNGVDIDFIEKDEPYAMINYYKSIPYELHKKQLELMKSEKSLEIAREIVLTKAKNQQNLIKYYARYRKKSDFDEYEKLKKRIELIDTLYKRAKKADSVEKLMGYEGSISVSYWKAFGILIDDKNFKRVTQNAPDAINQALNYGYAFIYNRVQSALLRAGLTLYYPFLHTQQKNKPALVFDMVEEFRQPIVDREIISILNKGGELNSSKGRLTADSVKLITQNIQERLATATKSRYGKQLLKNIIQEQSWQLSRVIDGKDDIFKGFVAKY